MIVEGVCLVWRDDPRDLTNEGEADAPAYGLIRRNMAILLFQNVLSSGGLPAPSAVDHGPKERFI
jgi:hypothetical protein